MFNGTYDEAILEIVEAAKVAVGMPLKEPNMRLSFVQFLKVLTKEGIPHSVLGDRSLQIRGLETIPPFGFVVWRYEEEIFEGKLQFAPEQLSFYSKVGKGSKRAEISEELALKVARLLPAYHVSLPEELVILPVPGWVFFDDPDRGYYGGRPDSWILFRSQAEKMWAEFTTQNPFAVATK